MKTQTNPAKAAKATTKQANVTQEADGTLTLHGAYAASIEARATRRGMTPTEYANAALQLLMEHEAKAQKSPPKTMSLVIPEGALRLSHQLHEDPVVMVHRLLRRGIQDVDWNLANDIGSPFAWSDEDDFDATVALDGFSLAQVDALEEYCDRAQRVLYVREMERRGIEYLGSRLNAPAGYGINRIGG